MLCDRDNNASALTATSASHAASSPSAASAHLAAPPWSTASTTAHSTAFAADHTPLTPSGSTAGGSTGPRVTVTVTS